MNSSTTTDSRSTVHVGMVIEQGLGHTAHSVRLQQHLPKTQLTPEWILIDDAGDRGWLDKVPNWTVKTGLIAAQQLHRKKRMSAFDVVFFHTQTPAMLNQHPLLRIPTVISLDATPEQMDAMGAGYEHRVMSPPVERAKHRIAERSFRLASHLVTTTNWAARSLQNDYGIDPSKVTTIPFGVDTRVWRPPAVRLDDETVRVLFVGGDFERKGGPGLLRALAATGLQNVELHVVGGAPPSVRAGLGCVRVTHHGRLVPDSEQLRDVFRNADLFCLPTTADCSPIVLNEAAAMGLPRVAARFGAVNEMIDHGVTGLVVEVGDQRELASALRSLIENRALRQRMGSAARAWAVANVDATDTSAKTADVIVAAAV